MPPRFHLMKTASKNSPFAKILDAWPEARLRELMARAGPGDVQRALGRESLHPEDLAALLSPAAAPFLEEIAQAAHRLTRQHFGRTIGLYAPIYLSNICHSDCTYCGYALHSGSQGEQAHPDAGGNPQRVRRPGRPRVPERAAPHRRSPQGGAAFVPGPGRGHRPGVFRLGGRGGLRPGPGGLPPAGGVRPGRGDPLHGDLPPGDLRRRCTAGAANGIMPTAWRPLPGRAGPRSASSVSGRCWASTTGGPTASGLGLHARQLQKECWQSAISLSFPRLRHSPAAAPGAICPDRPGVGPVDAGPEAISAGSGLQPLHPGKLPVCGTA